MPYAVGLSVREAPVSVCQIASHCVAMPSPLFRASTHDVERIKNIIKNAIPEKARTPLGEPSEGNIGMQPA
jgi:hypothetical protein